MEHEDVKAEYCELMICYGYITLFCAVFPLAPIFAVISVLVELKVDSYKMSTLE